MMHYLNRPAIHICSPNKYTFSESMSFVFYRVFFSEFTGYAVLIITQDFSGGKQSNLPNRTHTILFPTLFCKLLLRTLAPNSVPLWGIKLPIGLWHSTMSFPKFHNIRKKKINIPFTTYVLRFIRAYKYFIYYPIKFSQSPEIGIMVSAWQKKDTGNQLNIKRSIIHMMTIINNNMLCSWKMLIEQNLGVLTTKKIKQHIY